MSSTNGVTTGERHQVSDATKARAEELKTQGNAALAGFKFPHAVELYSAAIELHPTAIYYANRAAAHMKTESYGLAIDDASAAIETEPSYVKGTSDCACACFALCMLGLLRSWVNLLNPRCLVTFCQMQHSLLPPRVGGAGARPPQEGREGLQAGGAHEARRQGRAREAQAVREDHQGGGVRGRDPVGAQSAPLGDHRRGRNRYEPVLCMPCLLAGVRDGCGTHLLRII